MRDLNAKDRNGIGKKQVDCSKSQITNKLQAPITHHRTLLRLRFERVDVGTYL
jgi:hypothetical protein